MNNSKRVFKIVMIATIVVFAMGFTFLTKDVEAAGDEINVPVLVNETDDINTLTNHDIDVPAMKDEYTVKTMVATVPGQLYININVTQIENPVNIKLYTDEACVYPVTSSSYDARVNLNEVKRINIPITNSSKYYLKVWYSSEATVPGNINITPYMLARMDQTLTFGAWSRIMAPSYNNQVNYHKVVVPSSGYLGIEAKLPSTNSLALTLCRENKTEIVNTYPKNGGVAKYYFVTKGTYYFKTKGVSNEWSRIRCSLVKDQFSLKEKNSVIFSTMSSNVNVDIKFKAEKTGLLIMNGFSTSYADVTLLNAKKTELTHAKSYSGNTYMGFAVKKGVTYYLRAHNSGESVISYSIAGTAQGKNKTRKKAVTLKRNKKKVGLLIAGDKSKYWYKFKLTKKKKLQINIGTVGSGNYRSRVFDKKGRAVFITLKNGVVKSTRKLAKGTYYFVIEPQAKTSGRFDVTLKK